MAGFINDAAFDAPTEALGGGGFVNRGPPRAMEYVPEASVVEPPRDRFIDNEPVAPRDRFVDNPVGTEQLPPQPERADQGVDPILGFYPGTKTPMTATQAAVLKWVGPPDPDRDYAPAWPISYPKGAQPDADGVIPGAEWDPQGGVPGAVGDFIGRGIEGVGRLYRATESASRGGAFDPQDVAAGMGVLYSGTPFARGAGVLAAGPAGRALVRGVEPLAEDIAAGIGHNGGPLLRPAARVIPSSTESFGNHAGEYGLSSVPILYEDYPALKAGTVGVRDVAQTLQDRGRAALKELGIRSGVIDTPSPSNNALLSRVIAHETKAALDNSPNNASNWYTKKVEQALDIATVMHPELATDPGARMAYTGALAITSQGETVPRNARLTDYAYRMFQETGQFPTNLAVKKASINTNFGKMNDMLATMGPEELQKFLNQQFAVRDLNAMGYKIGGENKDTLVHGSAVFGPKIGNGFYQNLNGNYNPVTFDLWWMRNWGRLTGTLVGQQNPDRLLKVRARLEAAMTDQGIKVPKTMPALDRRVEDILNQHESDYKTFRPDFNSGARTKSELTYAAERWDAARAGLNETPSSGGQRTWMRGVVNDARSLLAQEGHPLTNADLQAIVWYPEKDLYAKLGGRSSEKTNVDYATALSDIARENGVGDDRIARALQPVGDGNGPR